MLSLYCFLDNGGAMLLLWDVMTWNDDIRAFFFFNANDNEINDNGRPDRTTRRSFFCDTDCSKSCWRRRSSWRRPTVLESSTSTLPAERWDKVLLLSLSTSIKTRWYYRCGPLIVISNVYVFFVFFRKAHFWHQTCTSDRHDTTLGVYWLSFFAFFFIPLGAGG